MKAIRTAVSALFGLYLGAAILAAEPPANPAWEKVKSLVGEWKGTADGKPTHVSYKAVSNGTAVMETIEGPDAMQMVTLYHPDGASLLMTHYCSMGNQPRMRSKGLEKGKLDFAYLDATNLGSAEQMRMTHLVMSFPDSDHLVEEWTGKEGAKEHVARFTLTRKK
jgi:hypothetical protein